MNHSHTTAEIAIWFLLLCGGSWADDAPRITAAKPVAGRLVAVGQVQTLAENEFEFFNLSGYDGAVTWDATLPDGSAGPLPVKFFEVKAGQAIIGKRLGADSPDVHLAPDGPSVAVFAVASGKASIAAWGIADGKAFKIATLAIQANIGPRPPPVPVDPVDPVDPMPVIGPLSVCIIEQTEDRAVIPPGQLRALQSTKIRQYLDEHCAKVDGRPQWRIFDADADMSAAEKVWQDVMKRPRKSTPWIVISNGAAGAEGPLPEDESKTLELLKRWGGE